MLRNFIHLHEHRSRLIFDLDSAVVTVFGHREHAAEVNAILLDEGHLPLLNTQPAPHPGGKCGDEGTPQPTPREPPFKAGRASDRRLGIEPDFRSDGSDRLHFLLVMDAMGFGYTGEWPSCPRISTEPTWKAAPCVSGLLNNAPLRRDPQDASCVRGTLRDPFKIYIAVSG